MNQLEMKAKILRNNRQIKKIEKSFITAINQELKRYYKDVAAKTKNNWSVRTILINNLTVTHQNRLEGIFKNYYKQVIRTSVDYTKEFYKKDILHLETKAAELYETLLQKYINANLLIRASSIAINSKRRITTILKDVINEGLPPEAQAAKISNIGKVSYARAGLIARTETFAALNYAQFGTAKDFADRFNVEKKKQWISFQDDRVRETHLEVNGELIGLNESFIVGGNECQYPHDESLPPEEVINCRCNLLFVNE